MTTLGNSTVLSIAVAAVVGFLLVKFKPAAAAMIEAGTLSGSLLVWGAKLHVARARPDVVLHLVEVTSRSLPSGQATNSTIVYLTLAVLASQEVERRKVRSYVLGFAIALVRLTVLSRVHLGLHRASNVPAG